MVWLQGYTGSTTASPNQDVISNFDNYDLDQSNTTIIDWQRKTVPSAYYNSRQCVMCCLFPCVSILLWYNLSDVCPGFLAENLNPWNLPRDRSVFVCLRALVNGQSVIYDGGFGPHRISFILGKNERLRVLRLTAAKGLEMRSVMQGVCDLSPSRKFGHQRLGGSFPHWK